MEKKVYFSFIIHLKKIQITHITYHCFFFLCNLQKATYMISYFSDYLIANGPCAKETSDNNKPQVNLFSWLHPQLYKRSPTQSSYGTWVSIIAQTIFTSLLLTFMPYIFRLQKYHLIMATLHIHDNFTTQDQPNDKLGLKQILKEIFYFKYVGLFS